MTRNGAQSSPEQFLDEDDVETGICFKNHVNNEIVFSNVLWKNFKVIQNHKLLAFPVEWIKFFLVFQNLAYSFVCYSLLKQYFQKGQLYELAWWLPLQLRHLNMWGHGSPFLVSSLGRLILSLALQHQMKWQ